MHRRDAESAETLNRLLSMKTGGIRRFRLECRFWIKMYMAGLSVYCLWEFTRGQSSSAQVALSAGVRRSEPDGTFHSRQPEGNLLLKMKPDDRNWARRIEGKWAKWRSSNLRVTSVSGTALEMTETISIRLRRPKSELLKRSGGNLNRWLNDLIDQALDEPVPDWNAHFRRPRRKFRYTADEARKAGR
jgi:hypothetical protein